MEKYHIYIIGISKLHMNYTYIDNIMTYYLKHYSNYH
jgi:hypothetical protein